jgi:tRNA threonylcarbamoyladenosine biosynthesis protein TsaB
MALILHIETATRICSIALANSGSLLCLRESSATNAHSSQVTLFIDEVLQEAGMPFTAIDAVAISMGPGSYTGLRIGVATAKGLCYALDKPLIAVPTLHAMAYGMPLTPSPSPGGRGEYICPMLDAKRMEVYCAIYDRDLNEIAPTAAVIVNEDSFAKYLHKGIVTFGGEGAEKCREVLEHHPNARFVSGFETTAKFMVPIAFERFTTGRFEDLAYFEPFYLKEFVAGKPRVKGLR